MKKNNVNISKTEIEIKKNDTKKKGSKAATAGNGVTEMVFILDRSGSMAGLVSDTIGGFNGMIEKQKKEEGKALVTTVLFDTQITTLHDRVDLQEVGPMTEKEYCVGGCTALLDALGGTIHHVMDIHRYIRPEDVPEHVIFVVTTDGMENSSREYNADTVRKLVKERRKAGWEFLFLGANIDAVKTGESFGFARENAVNYKADSIGTRNVYHCVGKAMASMRSAGAVDECWAEEVAADFEERGKK